MDIERRVSSGNIEELSRLLGTFDENLNIISRELQVFCRVDGLDIVISGADENVHIAQEVVKNLLVLVENGERVDG